MECKNELYEDRNPWFRYFTYIAITIALLLSWYGLPLLIKVVAVLYLAYKFYTLSKHNFTCFACQRKFAIALMIVAFAFIQFPPQFYIGAILLVWANELLEWTRRKAKKPSYNAY